MTIKVIKCSQNQLKRLKDEEFLSVDPLINQWIKNDYYSHIKEHKFEAVYLEYVDDKFRAFVGLHDKKEDHKHSNLVLLSVDSKISYTDQQPVPTLYELQFSENLTKAPELNLYRSSDEKIQLLTSSLASSTETSKSTVKFFSASSAELSLSLANLDKELFLGMTNRKNDVILDFASVKSTGDILKSLRYYLQLEYAGYHIDETTRLQTKKNIHDLLLSLSHNNALKKYQTRIYEWIQNNVFLLIYLIRLFEQEPEEAPIKLILKQILNLNSSLSSHARSVVSKEIKAQNYNSVWAYHIPPLINKKAQEMRAKLGNRSQATFSIGFIELDLDPSTTRINPATGDLDYNFGELIPALEGNRPRVVGKNQAGIVVGLQIDDLGIGVPVKRIVLLGDLTHSSKGAITAEECARVNAAIRLAAKENLPIDWFAASFGVEISTKHGIENLDASASTAREIVKYINSHQVAINIVVDLTNIGAQSYWNALAAILPNTPGILIMTQNGTMTLTGYKALVVALQRHTHSLDIDQSADRLYPEGLKSLGGFKNIYGPNGEAAIFAESLGDAIEKLLLHHYYSYCPIERFQETNSTAAHVSEERKKIIQHEIQNIQKGLKVDRIKILNALHDSNAPHRLDLWKHVQGPEASSESLQHGGLAQLPSTIVTELQIDGVPFMTIFPPCGPLTPTDSYLIAKAIYKAPKNQPLLILASITGFNSDPLSMQYWQLEAGALIAKAFVERQGPTIAAILGNLVGGTFVVFNKQLNPQFKLIAARGAKAQVVGGEIAAKIVFHHRILANAKQTLEASPDSQQDLRSVVQEIEKEEAKQFDAVHNAERALLMGSVDKLFDPQDLKQAILETLPPFYLNR